ncbi:MAG: sarcosine oxidase subunit beta [SAR324 cluster bacterium]|uniref:Sarcosine oxidase subunit beta n=1 Tax=SAR324 cluster bacterium TaxID=2024889 RepID=A0A432GNM5_9DELT|nr:MAG: sarcosine oxidase subunit beta [SAR324 cluster bacterium]
MTQRMWQNHDLKKNYDVVIIGGGAHGLATAFYLAKNHGITDVAVLEQKFIGYGGSGRNTAILRSNYRTEEGIKFYDQSLDLYEDLSGELDFNLMFSQQGHFTLGHSTASISGLVTRAENNKALGIDSFMLDPKEIKKMLPEIDITDHPRFPVHGALYHPPGGIIRHDAVVWAYARGADRKGVQIHQMTEVQDILVENGKATGVVTNRGTINCNTVISVVAGWSSEVCKKVNVKLPFVTHPLQALVTQSYKPWLHHVVVSGTLHIYLSQTDRGELVCGNGIDTYPHYGMRSTLGFLESYSAPVLHNVAVQRQWAGLCDMTPDYSPIISPIDEIDGFYVNGGWGTYGFKASPASGYNTAQMVANGKTPEMIEPFRYNRFAENRLVGEKAAASVGS